MRDSSGVATRQKPVDILGRIEVFGQHELAELASDKANVARMVERFAGLLGPSAPIPQYVRGAAREPPTAGQGRETLVDLENELADIPRLAEHEARYKETDLPTRLAECTQLDRDESVLDDISERLGDARAVLEAVAEAEAVAALVEPVDGIDRSPQQVHLSRARTLDHASNT